MQDERFYIWLPRWFLWMGAIFGAAGVIGGVTMGAPIGPQKPLHEVMVNELIALWCTGFFALGLWNYRRPVLEVSQRVVQYGSIFWFRRRSVPVEDVASVTSPGPRRLVLGLRSGSRVLISLLPVARRERDRARAAIEEVVGRP